MSVKTIDFKWKPLEHQKKAFESEAFELMVGGAKAGGKTQFICVYLFLYCMKYAGARCLLARRKLTMLMSSTWLTFQEIIPHEVYDFNGSSHTITFKNGSTIILSGLDSQEELNRFSGMELAMVVIDQAEECEKEHYIALKLQLKRQTLPDGTRPPYKMLVSANPKICYLRDIFILNPQPGEREFIQFLPTHNTYLDADYIPMMKRTLKDMPGLYAALVEGSWDIVEDSDAIIQYSKVEQAMKRTQKLAYFDKKIISIDVAREGDDKTVLLGWDGCKIVEVEMYGKKDLDITAARAVKMLKAIGANCIIWDADGIGGGLGSHLKHLIPEGVKLIEFHGSGKSSDVRYYNQRAEAWFEAAEVFNNDLPALPNDPMMAGELAAVKYEYHLGKLQAESKESVKKRISKSPDKGDAVVYGIYGLNRAPSLYQVAPVLPNTMRELMNDIEDMETESIGRNVIGNHNVEKWAWIFILSFGILL